MIKRLNRQYTEQNKTLKLLNFIQIQEGTEFAARTTRKILFDNLIYFDPVLIRAPNAGKIWVRKNYHNVLNNYSFLNEKKCVLQLIRCADLENTKLQ